MKPIVLLFVVHKYIPTLLLLVDTEVRSYCQIPNIHNVHLVAFYISYTKVVHSKIHTYVLDSIKF